jgi:hypothetical protein
MLRRVIAGLVVVGLAIGIWVLWPRKEPGPSPTTTIHAVNSSTSTKVATRTTGSTVDSHVVTTVEEAEDILRQLWFGWFEGIYNQDEERIKEVVATQALLDDGKDAFGADFVSPPTADAITFSETEILQSDADCLVTWGQMDVSPFRGAGATTQNVVVIRRVEDQWYLATTWVHKGDRWEADCTADLEPLS